MKKIYALAAVAMMAVAANAQNGAPLYATGDGTWPNEAGAWAPENPGVFTYADGKYTIEVKDLTMFKISTAMGDWDTFNAACYGCDYGKDKGAEVALEFWGDMEDPGNINAPWNGDWTITIAGDLSTITMTTDSEAPTGPVVIYLRGGMNNWGNGEGDLDGWALTMVEEEAVYEFVCAEGQSIPAGTEFKIADAKWSKVNYGAGGDVVFGESAEWNYNDNNGVMVADWNGYCKVEFLDGFGQPAFVTFTNDTEGVANVAADNSEAVYFNLQGVRVANAENGLFIVKKGNKVSKVFVK